MERPRLGAFKMDAQQLQSVDSESDARLDHLREGGPGVAFRPLPEAMKGVARYGRLHPPSFLPHFGCTFLFHSGRINPPDPARGFGLHSAPPPLQPPVR